MYDDDIDRNGIPDMIQRDPVVVPETADRFGDDVGLPGITAPIEAPAEVAPDGPATEIPEVRFDVVQDVTQNKARTASKAAEAMDGYIKD
jgi:hypothetical protein